MPLLAGQYMLGSNPKTLKVKETKKDTKKIEKLKALGDIGVTCSEIAEVQEKLAAGIKQK